MSIHDITDADVADLLNLIDAADVTQTPPVAAPVVSEPIVEPEPQPELKPIPEPVVEPVVQVMDEAVVVASIIEAETLVIESALAEVKADEVKQEIYKKQSDRAKKTPKAEKPDHPVYPDLEAWKDWKSWQNTIDAYKKPRKQKTPKPPKVPKAPKPPKAPKVPKPPKTPSFSPAAAVSASGFDGALSILGIEVGKDHPFFDRALLPDDITKLLAVVNQKHQKAILNLIAWKRGQDGLYLYTKYALEALHAQPQGVTKRELERFYMDKATKSGSALLGASTAYSQTEKYWHVLPAVGLAKYEENRMLASVDLSLLLT